MIFLIIQKLRSNESRWFQRFNSVAFPIQVIIIGILIYFVFVSTTAYFANVNEVDAGTQFIYFEF